jgi:hypothetical protein
MTVSYVHQRVAGEFLSDLRAAVRAVRKPALRKSAAQLMIKAANTLTRILPKAWMSTIMERAGSMMGGDEGLPGRMAPIYGLFGSLPNRGDLKELVLDLMDNINRYKGAPAPAENAEVTGDPEVKP